MRDRPRLDNENLPPRMLHVNLMWPALKKGLMMVDLKMCAMAVPTAAKLNGAAAIAVAKHPACELKCCGSAENDMDCEDVVVDDKDTDGGTTALQHKLFLKGWQLVHRRPDITHLQRMHLAF